MQRKEKKKRDKLILSVGPKQRKAEKCSEWQSQWEGCKKEQDEKLRAKMMLNNPRALI